MRRHLSACGFAWFALIASLDFVAKALGTKACESNYCSSSLIGDAVEEGDILSLLQTATNVQRHDMPAREKLSHHGNAWADEKINALEESNSSGRQLDFFKREDIAFRRNHLLRYVFPTEDSTPDEVANFFIKFGSEGTASQMKESHVDGLIFLHMTAEDLDQYGMDEVDTQTILNRIETARSQSLIRQMMANEMHNTRAFHGTSALHDVVGADGVFLISLDRMSERYNESANVLNQIGIKPVKISAVDAAMASRRELAQGCSKAGDPGVLESCQNPGSQAKGKTGYGCIHSTEQAVAASHRKALQEAKKRGGEWTAIVEDDAVPAPVENWNLAFRNIWKQLPAWVKFVRLGWCQLGSMDLPDPVVAVPYANTSGATLIEKEGCCGTMYYDPGGCTTAYIVHRDILDEMLNLFPCCSALDSCYKWDYFKAYNPETKQERGLDIMMSMDSHNKPLWDDGWVEQHGMFLQDRVMLESAQQHFQESPEGWAE